MFFLTVLETKASVSHMLVGMQSTAALRLNLIRNFGKSGVVEYVCDPGAWEAKQRDLEFTFSSLRSSRRKEEENRRKRKKDMTEGR